MSPAKTARKPSAQRLALVAFLSGFLAMAANAAAIGIFVTRSDSARDHNCGVVEDAFAEYTEALREVVLEGATDPARVERVSAQAEALKRRIADHLAACK